MVKAKQFALIHWVPTAKHPAGGSDVINLATVSNPQHRKEGASIKLTYQSKVKDKKSGKVKNVTQHLPAKILLIHNSQKYLQNIEVDPLTGAMSSSTKKIFSKEMRDKRSDLKAINDKASASASANQEILDRRLAQSPDIFSASTSANGDMDQRLMQSPDIFKRTTPDDLQLSDSMSVDELPHSGVKENVDPSSDTSDIPNTSNSNGGTSGSIEGYGIEALSSFLNLEKIEVTPQIILFVQTLLSILKTMFHEKNKTIPTSSGHSAFTSSFKIPDSFRTPGPNKEQIGSSSGYYLPKIVHKYILRGSTKVDGDTMETVHCWKSLTRQVLVQIYGDELKNYCAKGSRGNSKGIDPDLYLGIYEMASNFVELDGTIISPEEFLKLVNEATRNKKRGPVTASQEPPPKKPKSVNTKKVQSVNVIPSPARSQTSSRLSSPLNELRISSNVNAESNFNTRFDSPVVPSPRIFDSPVPSSLTFDSFSTPDRDRNTDFCSDFLPGEDTLRNSKVILDSISKSFLSKPLEVSPLVSQSPRPFHQPWATPRILPFK